MSSFLTKADYRSAIRSYRFDQLLADDDHTPEYIMDDAEGEAVATVRDALHTYYDVNALFAARGDARHKSVVHWVRCLALYYIFRRLPDDLVPERVIKDYDHCLERLDALAAGRRGADLPAREPGGDTAPTKSRWGSRPARSHGDT